MRTSVVIAARSGPAAIRATLDSLKRVPQYSELEVVVASSCGAAVDREIAACYPGVAVISLPAAGIAELRAAAIRKTAGDIVAILNERYRVPPDWVDTLWRAHQAQPAEVIAGCVAPPAGMSGAQWAMYWSEYAHAAPPLRSGTLGRGEAARVPGGNVSYKRPVLHGPAGTYTWELEFHARLFDQGARFYRAGGMTVECGRYTVAEYLAERCEVSRDLAARRAAALTPAGRIGAAALRVALPAILPARIARAALRGKPLAGGFVRAIPWIAVFALVQAWSEMRGFLGSRAGANAARRAVL